MSMYNSENTGGKNHFISSITHSLEYHKVGTNIMVESFTWSDCVADIEIKSLGFFRNVENSIFWALKK